jgi:uncharacterized protein (DUF2141 family)
MQRGILQSTVMNRCKMRDLRCHLLAVAVAALPGFLASGQAAANDLTIIVRGVRDARGVVRVDVCDKANFQTDKCPFKAEAPSMPGEVVIEIRDLPPGIYAVQAFQDADNDGEMQQNFLGIPREGVGFGNGAKIGMSAPSFEASSTDVTGPSATTEVTLRYF